MHEESEKVVQLGVNSESKNKIQIYIVDSFDGDTREWAGVVIMCGEV